MTHANATGCTCPTPFFAGPFEHLPTCPTRAVVGPYVAVRFPDNHVVFHMLFNKETLGERPADAYDVLSQLVQTSVREALEDLGVEVVETGEEAIGG